MSDNETGWVKDNGSYYYYYSDGSLATGWQKLDGDWYYFYGDGSMTWSNEVDGYYLGADGRMVTDEKWVNTEEDNSGTWYYVGDHEKVVIGWNKIGDDFHYFNHPGGSMTWSNTIDGFDIDSDGKIVSGTGWLQDEYSENWYYFSDGKMSTGWIQDGGNWYYLNNDGTMATGWQQVDGDWYYFYSDGTMATGWVNDGTGWYYLYGNGSMAWGKTVDGYLLDNGGKMVTGTGWQALNGDWYYLNNDKEEIGWQFIDGNSYYLYGDNGSMAWGTTIDGYSLDDTGKWVTGIGWKQDGDDWYYFDDGGKIQKDKWVEYNGDYYCLGDDGKMMKSTYIKDANGTTICFGSDGKAFIGDDGIVVDDIDNALSHNALVEKIKEVNELFKFEFVVSGQNLDNRPENADACDLYVTDEQEKLADTAAGMLTTELGGTGVAILANGVRAYKSLETGETLYDNSVVAGIGAGNIKKVLNNTDGVSKAIPEKVVNDLANYESKRFTFGSEEFTLDKSGMKHILERHHPEYWEGSVKSTQTFLEKDMSIDDITNTVSEVLKQNREKLIEKGTTGMYQVEGTVDGVDYVVGLNKGRVGQFYKK